MTSCPTWFSRLLSGIILCIAFSSHSYGQGCTENYFLKQYSEASHTPVVSDMVTVDDNGVIMVGYFGTIGSIGSIIRLDSNGNKLWEQTIGVANQLCVTRRIIQLRDDNFLIAGYSANVHFLLKISASGAIIWRKDINGLGINEIAEDIDGSIYAAAGYSLNVVSGCMILKFTSTGDVVYGRSYLALTDINPLIVADLFVKDGAAYIVGRHGRKDPSGFSTTNGVVCKIESSSGDLQWAKLYDYEGGPQIFERIFDYGPGKLCLVGQNDLNSSNLTNIFIIDTSGSIDRLAYFRFGLDRQFGKYVVDSNRNIIYTNFQDPLDPIGLMFCSVNPYQGVMWAKHIPAFSQHPRPICLAISVNNSLYSAGTFSTPLRNIFIGKHSQDGEIGCPSSQVVTSFGTANSSVLNIGMQQNLLPATTAAAPNNFASTNLITQEVPICTLTNTCSTFSIAANTPVCRLTDTLYINFTKNAGCTTPPKLIFDPVFFRLVDINNTNAKLIPLQTGISSIEAQLMLSCDTLIHELSITIHNSPDTIDLGADFSICPGNSKIIEAGIGFDSYLWQDGSTGNTLTITNPGTYFVEATDFCGVLFNDTIIISAGPSIPLELGSNLSKCNGDSLQIQAPTGFNSYSWSPTYATTSTNHAAITVFPSTNTMYYLTVEQSPGCTATDSIFISVNHSPLIDFGPDRSVCAGDSLVLDAGVGFSEFLWSNGSTASQTTLYTSGIYSFIGTTTQECKSYDTIAILNVWNAPTPILGTDSTLCIGSTRTLTPGAFSNYLWHDGTTGPSYPVMNAGLYHVTVTDDHQCKASDSLVVNTLFSSPKGYLPRDTVMCNYGTMTLRSITEYENYLWNTNTSMHSLTISSPGTYWLQVRDTNNCVGRDSIIVGLSECLKGFYIPSAFTPNNNGVNDIYRPILGGNVRSYVFTIFNRWGTVVFRSTQVGRGWDGKFNGLPQDSNLFIWTCVYEFEGGSKKQEKGTVMLIR